MKMTKANTTPTEKPSIHCDLESGRVEELDFLLSELKSRIVTYVSKAGAPDASIGPRKSPTILIEELNLQVPTQGQHSKGLLAAVDKILENSVVTWHPGFMDKLYASTNPVGVVSDLVLSVLNTNSHVYTVSPVLTIIEKKVSKWYAKLFGFTGDHSGGLTFSGGSWSNVTSLQIARSILFPETKLKGNYLKFALFTSKHSHYSVEKAAILLGLGSNAVFKIDVNSDGTMNTEKLEQAISEAKEKSYTPLYINATAGTTVFGSFDNFEAISAIAKKNNLWFHIDGSWGGNFIFSPKLKYKLNGSHLADSITTNPHKMLGVPTTCSFLLLPDERVFQQSMSLAAPYLFHNNDAGDNFDLADGTMGCGRRADSVKFFLGWLYYGTTGYQQRIEHAYDVASYFADSISNIAGFHLISDLPLPCLQVCFYYDPSGRVGEDGDENTKITRFVSHKLHDSGKFLVDFAPNPDSDRGEFFRVVFNSPIISSNTCHDLIDAIVEAGKEYQASPI